MRDDHQRPIDWLRLGRRVLAALLMVFVGLLALYLFGRNGDLAEKSQDAAFETKMAQTRAKVDGAQARVDAMKSKSPE